MLGPAIYYDPDGNVIATRDLLVRYDEDDPDRPPIGMVDFEATEASGIDLQEYLPVEGAVGATAWPEWLGGKALGCKVERDGSGKVTALVHPSGHRRDKAEIKARIAERIEQANGQPADIRDIVGGPQKPLELTEGGTTRERARPKQPAVPMIVRRPAG